MILLCCYTSYRVLSRNVFLFGGEKDSDDAGDIKSNGKMSRKSIEKKKKGRKEEKKKKKEKKESERAKTEK